MNISKEGRQRFKVVVTLSDGTVATEHKAINLASDYTDTWWFSDKNGKCFGCEFNYSSIIFNYTTGAIYLPLEDVLLRGYGDEEEGKDLTNIEIVNFTLVKEKESNTKYC